MIYYKWDKVKSGEMVKPLGRIEVLPENISKQQAKPHYREIKFILTLRN